MSDASAPPTKKRKRPGKLISNSSVATTSTATGPTLQKQIIPLHSVVQWNIHKNVVGTKVRIGDVLATTNNSQPLKSELDGQIIQSNEEEVVIEGCSHDEIYNGMCTICLQIVDKKTDKKSQLLLLPQRPDFIITKPEIIQDVLQDQHTNLLEQQKLSLILDLDNTLLHATTNPHVTVFDHSFFLKREKFCIKLRAYVRQFLQEASKLFQLHIFTHGDNAYALQIAKFLDPEGTIFETRIVSRDNCPDITTKSLKDFFHSSNQTDYSTVLVIDDREDVWDKHLPNVIQIAPFSFYDHHKTVNHQMEEEEGEVEDAQVLSSILKMLQTIHYQFFNGTTKDVTKLFSEYKKQILGNVTMCFSRVIPLEVKHPEETFPLWIKAEEFGATVVKDLNLQVTHLVIGEKGTQKVVDAQKIPGTNIVFLQWLTDCFKYYRRMNELDYYYNWKQVKQLPISKHYKDVQTEWSMFTETHSQIMQQIHQSWQFLLQQQPKKKEQKNDTILLQKRLRIIQSIKENMKKRRLELEKQYDYQHNDIEYIFDHMDGHQNTTATVTPNSTPSKVLSTIHEEHDSEIINALKSKQNWNQESKNEEEEDQEYTWDDFYGGEEEEET